MTRPYIAYYVVRIEDVYPSGVPAIPQGFRDVAFRCPKVGEYGLVQGGSAYKWTSNSNGPRIILEPIKLKEIVFRETGEVRPPKPGEWFMSHDNRLDFSVMKFTTNRSIYTRTEREV